ncbi:hypothetical protein ABZ446_25950 [Streptomyces sp. NPDC005813]|uniref:hypothetical protein n=1 Tax=Streptomyces sp. NPDC005813 TaxID=3155592 RepID=UPI0033CA4C37
MNVVGPGEPLEPVSSGLTPSVDSWVRAFRSTVMVPLLSGDEPLTLAQVAAWLTARAPGLRERQRRLGKAAADRLQTVRSGRDEMSVQRMVSGRLVPTRDVVLDLLQLLGDRGPQPSRESAESLWRLYRPALRSRRPDVAEAYDVIDERDAARAEAEVLRRQVNVLEAEQGRALLGLTRASLKLLGVHRALAAAHKELETGTRSTERARAEERRTRLHWEAAVDRLDRLKDAYERLREQAVAVQEESAADREEWQERQALLLERLSRAEEDLARAVQDAQNAREDLEHERRSARRTASRAQDQADLSRAEAAKARQEAAASEARRLAEAAASQAALHDAELHHAQAMDAIAHLEGELRQARTELRDVQQRVVRADAELVQAMRERAVEADAQDVLSQALAAMRADQDLGGLALIAAAPESPSPVPEADAAPPAQGGTTASATGVGAGAHAPPGPDGGPGARGGGDRGGQVRRRGLQGGGRDGQAGDSRPQDGDRGGQVPRPGPQGGGRPSAGRRNPAEEATARTRRDTRTASRAEPAEPAAPPSRSRPEQRRSGRLANSPFTTNPHWGPNRVARVALLVATAVALFVGLPALVWWSWGRDTPLVAGRESPRAGASPRAKTTPSLPPRPARDTVADIGDQPVNTGPIMKLPACAGSVYSLRLASEHNTYTGRNPHLTLTVEAAGDAEGVPCRVNASRAGALLTFTSADQGAVIWKSSACADGHSGPRWLQLSRTQPVTVDFHWNRRATGKDCEEGTAAPYTTYLAEASLSGADEVRTSFVLARNVTHSPTTTTPTPSAGRSSATNTTSGGSNGSNDSIGGLLSGGRGQATPSDTASPSDDPTGVNGSGGANGANGGGDGSLFGGPAG